MNDFTTTQEESGDPDLRPGPAPVLLMEDPPPPHASAPEGPAPDMPFSADFLDLSRNWAEGEQKQPATAGHPVGGGQTIMPRGWKLNGDIESSSPVRLAGVVVGNVTMSSVAAVEICVGASMSGIVSGSNVTVRGEFTGEINAAGGAVAVEQTARIKGTVRYKSIRMDGGTHQMQLVYAEVGDSGND